MHLLHFDFPDEWVGPLGYINNTFYFVKQRASYKDVREFRPIETELCRVPTKLLYQMPRVMEKWAIGHFPINYFKYTATSPCSPVFYSFGDDICDADGKEQVIKVNMLSFKGLCIIHR